MKALMLKKQDKIYAPVHFHHSALKAEPVRGKNFFIYDSMYC